MSKFALDIFETFLTLTFIPLFAMNAIITSILTIAIILFDLTVHCFAKVIAGLTTCTIAASCSSLKYGARLARSVLRFATATYIGITTDSMVFLQYSNTVGEMFVVCDLGNVKRTKLVGMPSVPHVELDDATKLIHQRNELECTTPELYKEVWRDVFFAGTAWHELKQVEESQWDFGHLDDALNKGGDLQGKQVHLFGVTEPQLVEGNVLLVPAIVAVECKHPPPSLVGITSVQRSSEEIVPMCALEMEWHPHVPNLALGRADYKSRVHVLKCALRRTRLPRMQEAAVRKYDYVLPYILRSDQKDDITLQTELRVFVAIEGRDAPLVLEYDIELDNLDDFIAEQIESNDGLTTKKNHDKQIRKAITEAIFDAEHKFAMEKAARKKLIDDIPEEFKRSVRQMRLSKFYPRNRSPDLSKFKSKFVNRYYGHANVVR